MHVACLHQALKGVVGGDCQAWQPASFFLLVVNGVVWLNGICMGHNYPGFLVRLSDQQ